MRSSRRSEGGGPRKLRASVRPGPVGRIKSDGKISVAVARRHRSQMSREPVCCVSSAAGDSRVQSRCDSEAIRHRQGIANPRWECPMSIRSLDSDGNGSWVVKGIPKRGRSFRFRAEPSVIPEARSWVTRCLRQWRVDRDTLQSVELVASELFTNVVRHTKSKDITCVLVHGKHGLEMEVRDEGNGGVRTPMESVEPFAESGRGILLVQALTGSWGVGCRGYSHVVWARWAPALEVEAGPAVMAGRG
ncbi:ATP-binding protein [Streptomyces zaomyceticus]|uniref:ATP-binding protein n=1 Tax=Streptomyces zaomyceticus TaxID=68286 RepID=UPI003690F580